jgi:UV DNA damage repair endonuclease
MPKQHENSGSLIERHNKPQWVFDAKLNYLASEIMEMLAIEDADEMTSSIERAILVCNMLHIPLRRNFHKVFSFDGNDMTDDWKISALACYLIIINSDPKHEGVAKAQLWFALNQPAYQNRRNNK